MKRNNKRKRLNNDKIGLVLNKIWQIQQWIEIFKLQDPNDENVLALEKIINEAETRFEREMCATAQDANVGGCN